MTSQAHKPARPWYLAGVGLLLIGLLGGLGLVLLAFYQGARGELDIGPFLYMLYGAWALAGVCILAGVIILGLVAWRRHD